MSLSHLLFITLFPVIFGGMFAIYRAQHMSRTFRSQTESR